MLDVLEATADINYGVKGMGFLTGARFIRVPNDATVKGFSAVPIGKLGQAMPVDGDKRAVFLPEKLVKQVGQVQTIEDVAAWF